MIPIAQRLPSLVLQAIMYSRGEFRDMLFTPQDVAAHAERTYHPGDLPRS
jgi:hypothetical protein